MPLAGFGVVSSRRAASIARRSISALATSGSAVAALGVAEGGRRVASRFAAVLGGEGLFMADETTPGAASGSRETPPLGGKDDEWQNDYDAMRQGVGDAVITWAGVETALAELLAQLLRAAAVLNYGAPPPGEDEWSGPDAEGGMTLQMAPGRVSLGVAETIYFTPVNTETRIEIVSNVFSKVMMVAVDQVPAAARVKRCWDKVSLHLTRARKTRNKVAHGTITLVHKGRQPRIRFTGPVLDTIRSFARPHPLGRGAQLPGMSAHDVREVMRTFVGCEAYVLMLNDVIALLCENGQADAFADKLRELEARLNLGASRREGGQTGPEPPGQL